jgi:hypothetical protein
MARELIDDALRFLAGNEPCWELDGPIDREKYLADVLRGHSYQGGERLKLHTLYVNAEEEIALGAVRVRAALGRTEDGTTLDHGLFYYYESRGEAEDARRLVEATAPGVACTIKEYEDADPADGDPGVGG